MAANYFDKYDQQAGNYFDKYDAPVAAKPEKTGMLRAAADIPVQVGRGIAVGVKALSDVFGADNPVSRAASGVEGYLGELLSAQAKNDQAEIARIMKAAEDKGVGDQVTAAVKAFATAPVDMLSQALGTAVPVIAGGLVGSIARLGAAGVTAVGTGVGAAMGAGTVKGQIYDAVKQELLANKVPEAEAEKRAQEAQAYGGKNLDQILMGAGIGAAEAAFGAERILTGLLRKGAIKPSALPPAGRIPLAAATEALPEAAQAAQEQIAQNIALQREGYDVPTVRGVAGQAALEGIAGMGLGAIAGAAQRTAPEAKVTKKAETPEGKVAGRTTVVTDEETAARLREEAAEPETAEAEAPKPVTGEAGIVRPEEETPISRAVAEEVKPEIEPIRQIKSAELMSPPTPQEISQSVASTEQDVPSEGMVRMYHGGRGPEELTGPVWFTLDRRNAEGWAKRDPSMRVWYVDVPERALVEDYGYSTIKQAREDGFVPVPNLELPEDFAKNRKPLPLAEKKAPIPAGVEEGRAIRPETGVEPSVAEDRERAEPVEPQKAEAEAPKPVTGEAGIVRPEEEVSVPEPVVAEEVTPTAKTPSAESTTLTIEYGGSDINLNLGKPVWQATDDDLVKAVQNSGAYLGKPGSKYDPYMAWREAHSEAIQQAKREGKTFPPEVLYDKPGLIRDDLSDSQADEATDVMVDVYRATKDYGKAVEAYRNFGKKRAAEAPSAGEARPEGRVQPEGEGRAAVSDEEVKKSLRATPAQTAKERQAEINRERQQAKREAAEAKRIEQERIKAEKEAEAKRKAEEAEAKRKAKEAEAKRLAKEAEERRKAEEAEAKRKSEEEEAKRKLEALPPYEERVKLSEDDLYPYLKDFDSAVNAIYDKASNPADKEIASLIKARVAQFKQLGFDFSLRVTPEGKMLSSGALGNSVITFSHIGEATTVAITLNHPSNKDQSGTRWETVAHELLHAVTQAQLRFAPKGAAAQKLKALFNDVVH